VRSSCLALDEEMSAFKGLLIPLISTIRNIGLPVEEEEEVSDEYTRWGGVVGGGGQEQSE
jgi:hypothetical protein